MKVQGAVLECWLDVSLHGAAKARTDVLTVAPYISHHIVTVHFTVGIHPLSHSSQF